MSTTTARERRKARRYAVEREIAPHVDPRWAEAVLLELRLQGVAGDLIGEALGEVDSHCAESGEGARDAFGDPVEYARSLGLPRSPGQSPSATIGTVVPTVVQLVGMFGTLWSVPELVAGERLTVTVGQALSVLVLAAAVMVLAWRAEPLLRAALRRPVVTAVSFGAGVAVLAVPLLLLDSELVAVAAAPALGLGVALLATGVVVELLRARRLDAADPVVAPLQGAEATTRRSRESRRTGLLGALLVPVWTLVVAVLLGWLAS
jgi:hypothetical protein